MRDLVTLFTWIGPDEEGRPFYTVKHAVAAPPTPLVDTRRDKIDRKVFERQMQMHANHWQIEIRLVACREVDTIKVLRPRTHRWRAWRFS